jgi:hypothetical protein
MVQESKDPDVEVVLPARPLESAGRAGLLAVGTDKVGQAVP